MGQLLRVVQRAGEGNLLRVEEYLAREKDSGVALSEEVWNEMLVGSGHRSTKPCGSTFRAHQKAPLVPGFWPFGLKPHAPTGTRQRLNKYICPLV
jgi:hypothetical protein